MKEFAKGFYDGAAWRKCRDSFIALRISIDGGLCQRCKGQPGLIVHHREELNAKNINEPDIALNQALLEYVCLECHNKEHGRFFPASGRTAIFDENGDVIAATSPR